MTTTSILSRVRRHPKDIRKDTSVEIERDASGLLHFLLDLSQDRDVEFLGDYLVRCMKMDRSNQIQCAALLEKQGVMELLNQFSSRRPGDAFSPDYVDLWYLYEYIRTAQPREILELGSGFSTVVMGAALLHNGAGRLHAIEAAEEWAESTQAALPDAVRPSCRVKYSRSTDCVIADFQSRYFTDVPAAAPDMIYIDGAPEGALWLGAETVGMMEQSLEPGTCIFIDSRINAVLFFLKKIARRNYRIEANVVAVSDRRTRRRLASRFGLDQLNNCCITLIE